MSQRTARVVLRTSLVLAALLAAASPAQAQHRPHAGMMRYPDVSATHIVFAYANDLWIVPRDGGVATLVASPPGAEAFPRFSPDGQTIAFVGNYDGNRDIYTIPVEGGVPFRVTHHPAAETLCDWAPDGALVDNWGEDSTASDAGRGEPALQNGQDARATQQGGPTLLFFASGYAGVARHNAIYAVPAAGGLPQKLPVPYGAVAAISPDGVWLAYTPHTRDHHTWKRYLGGMATDIWLFNLREHTSKKMTDWAGTDSQPMWHGKTVYYISDDGPTHKLNIWSYDTVSGKREQITRFDKFDVKWPAIGPGPAGGGEIVFQNGAALHLLDLTTRKSRVVEIIVPGDRPTLRPQRTDVQNRIDNFDVSPTGQRAVLEARGDIWTVPARHGSPRNMTRTSGIAERDPAWSPDGQWIAYLSDDTGEYELYVTQSDGQGDTKRLTTSTPPSIPTDGKRIAKAAAPSTNATTTTSAPSTAPTSLPTLPAAYRYDPTWSPDSKHLVFSDKSGALYLHTVEGGATVLIDTDPWSNQPQFSWSHDSNWVAYTRSCDNTQSAVWLYHRPTGARHQLTSGFFNANWPTFDREGKYLYYATNSRFADPIYQDVGTAFIYTNTDVLVVVPLRDEVGSPWAPKTDEETWKGKDEKKPANTQPATAPTDSAPATKPADEEANDEEPQSAPASQPAAESEPARQPTTATAESKPADEKGEKKEEEQKPLVIELAGLEARALPLPIGPGGFGRLGVNSDGKLLYVRTPRTGGGEAAIKIFDVKDEEKEEKTVLGGVGDYRLSADGKKLLVQRGDTLAIVDANPDQNLNKPVSLAGLTVEIDPRAEWRQVFNEAWRVRRDFFYDPHMHGVNWPAIRDQYAQMLDDCVSRADVGYIIREMISELNVGHAYYGGDPSDEPHVEIGLLGADLELHAGAYRIQAIFGGGPWDVDARGPLSRPGIKAKVGDYLLAVNGVPLDPTKDPWAAFQGQAPGRVITLTVGDTPTRDDSTREVVMRLISSEEDSALRYRAWVERNRAYVAEQTAGNVGYIHVPNTGADGQNELFRQFLGQREAGALIIDERWNGGGQIPTRFIELLNRPVLNYWARRDGRDWRWPEDGHPGPKCMLINPMAGSGGDAFPYYFRQARLGKLIGMRTWGGLVGITGNPGLIDGTSMSVPTFGFYETDGTWGIEGHGVDPDIEVVDDPALMVAGGDPQLDAAIKQMLKELEEHPYVPPPPPPYPDRSGMGLPKEDR